MKKSFASKFKKLVFYLFIVFLLLFIFRLIYGYSLPKNTTTTQSGLLNSFSVSKRNYASKTYQNTVAKGNASAVKVDQKYEKIAEIKTQSSKFVDEEKMARQMVKKYNALVQFEQKSGNVGYRNLNLVIGVPPASFDSLYSELIKIGKVQAKQITKKDKTNEYKELNAKKQSLEKIRTSLIDLKSKGGKIEEYMDLENRILEIEQQLQGLGVSLGDFDAENEFCTVKFSLHEGREVKISLMHRVKVALEWTIKYYLRIVTSLFFVTLFAYLLLLIVEKAKVMERIVSKRD